MEIDIVHHRFIKDIYGLSARANRQDYTGTAFRLSASMWDTVKTQTLKNKGMNIWVYDPADMVFAGVELSEPPPLNTGLEHRRLDLPKYARYKHIGSYQMLKQAGLNMRTALKNRGLEPTLPYVEIYGHWTKDESRLETELLLPLL